MDLVIFACLDFREFVILGLFTKSRNRELSISMIDSSFIIKISRDSKIREFVLLAKFAKIKPSRILPDLQYIRTKYDKLLYILTLTVMTYFYLDHGNQRVSSNLKLS